MEKFIYVFSEADRDALLSHGYVLLKSPKKKRPVKQKKVEDEEVKEIKEPQKEEIKIWIFANKSARDMILDSMDEYAFSNILTY